MVQRSMWKFGSAPKVDLRMTWQSCVRCPPRTRTTWPSRAEPRRRTRQIMTTGGCSHQPGVTLPLPNRCNNIVVTNVNNNSSRMSSRTYHGGTLEGFGGPVNVDPYTLDGIDPTLDSCCQREVGTVGYRDLPILYPLLFRRRLSQGFKYTSFLSDYHHYYYYYCYSLLLARIESKIQCHSHNLATARCGCLGGTSTSSSRLNTRL
jgi:hypothetical protein